MGKLFDIKWNDDKPSRFERCYAFFKRNCNPFQMVVGMSFGAVGIGFTATGFMMSEGVGFLAQLVGQAPYHIYDTNLNGTIDYLRESYSQSVQRAMEAGYKQFPFTYALGHYVGGKIRDLPNLFRRK